MGQRLQLHERLTTIMGEHKVYFQPPEDQAMTYPCIVYEKDDADSVFADNVNYRYTKRYQVTVIDRDPDSVYPDEVAKLPMCSLSRNYVANQLNHDVFNLYF